MQNGYGFKTKMGCNPCLWKERLRFPRGTDFLSSLSLSRYPETLGSKNQKDSLIKDS